MQTHRISSANPGKTPFGVQLSKEYHRQCRDQANLRRRSGCSDISIWRWHMALQAFCKAWLVISMLVGGTAVSRAQNSSSVDQCRIGKVLFHMPEGWQRKTGNDGIVRLT